MRCRASLWLLLVLLLCMTPWHRALAHASLLGSEPGDGAVLTAAPGAVVLRFDEPVTLLALRILGPGGAEVRAAGAPGQAGAALRARLPEGLADGVYLVTWRVASADGHPVAGTLSFGIGDVALPVAREMAAHGSDAGRIADAGPRAFAARLARFLFYLAFVLAAGGALFRALVAEPPARVRRGIVAAGLAGILLAALSLGGRAALLLAPEAPLTTLLDTDAWRSGPMAGLATSFAVSATGLALVVIAALPLESRAPGRALGIGGVFLGAAGLSLTGHTAATEPWWPAAAVLIVHALAVVFWVGAFWPLRALLAERDGAEAVPAARRFAALAVPAVALLLLAGGGLAAVRLHGDPALLLSSDYGALLLAKLGGVGVLLLLAAVNRQRLAPALAAGRPGAAAWLSRSIAGEALVAAVVLGVTAFLVVTPPPGRGAPLGTAANTGAGRAEGEGVAARAQAADGSIAEVRVWPGRVGANRVTVSLQRAGGAPLAPSEVWLEMAQEAAGVAPIRRRMRPAGSPGRFVHEGRELALPGRWSVRVEALIGDFDLAIWTAVVDVSGPGR